LFFCERRRHDFFQQVEKQKAHTCLGVFSIFDAGLFGFELE
jgi:hypothetical protein